MADLPEDRLRLARLWRNGGPQHSSPGLRPFRAEQESCGPPSSALLRPLRGAPPVVSGLTMAIEATVVAARYKPGDRTMIIGSFKKVGEGYEGEIVTLTQKIRGIRFVPEANRASDNVPNFRVQIGKLEAGAAWIKHTTDWREYLSVKLDDPTLPGPIFASLFEEEGGAYNLVWSRQRPRNGD
jgi:uncharacterized protein (DUF736 family)